MGITSRLVSFVLNTSFADLPSNVIATSKQMMLNAAAVGLAGSATKEGNIIAQYVQRMGGGPECTILGKGIRSSSANAALANGTMVHVLDYTENIRRRNNHPSGVIFPVVMALGEQMALPGKDVMAAFAIGCEVCTKIGAAGDLDKLETTIHKLGWYQFGVTGTIGAAAAAGKLLGLGQEQMEYAMGIAVAQASGVAVNDGTSAKSFECGHAAMSGILAAMLAQHGFTAARNAVEAANGFFGCYRRDINVDEDEFIHHLGNPYDVIDPGVALKVYPCFGSSRSAVDATLHLVEEHKISHPQVRSVRVNIPEHQVGLVAQPETGLQGKNLSIHYCVAVALVHGQPRIHHFTDEAVKDPQVRAVIDRVTVEQTERATREVYRPSTVTITLADGQEVSCRVEHPKGHPSNPLTAQELGDKFQYCSRDILPSHRIENVIAQFRRLEALPDVRPLFSSLAGGEV